MIQRFKNYVFKDLATMKIKEMDLTPEQLESLMMARTFKNALYFLLIVITAIILSPFFSPFYWKAEVPVSGLISILQWLGIPLSAILGAMLARWKGIVGDKKEKKEDGTNGA